MGLNLKELNEKYRNEFLKFERVESKKHPVPDIHVFLTLDELAPASYPSGERCDIVAFADHDKIGLATDPRKLAEAATEEQFRDLLRAGLCYDEDEEAFFMFT
jgi:hypothetical protein